LDNQVFVIDARCKHEDPAYYSHGTGKRTDKSVGAWNWPHFHLAPGKLYLDSSLCFHGLRRDSFAIILPLVKMFIRMSRCAPDSSCVGSMSYKLMSEDNIKIYCKEIRCELMDLVKLVKNWV